MLDHADAMPVSFVRIYSVCECVSKVSDCAFACDDGWSACVRACLEEVKSRADGFCYVCVVVSSNKTMACFCAFVFVCA